MTNPSPAQLFAPTGTLLRLDEKSLAWKLGAIVLGSLVLTLSSYVTVPMYPVPMTMQTMAVGLVGALYGWRLGGATVAFWLMQAAVGMPVLSGGNGGLPYMMGPTAGYLAAFVLAAMLTGWLAERGWGGHVVAKSFLAQIAQNGLTLVIGTAWLAVLIGSEKAIAAGFMPFLLGAVLKSAIATGILAAVGLQLNRKDQDAA